MSKKMVLICRGQLEFEHGRGRSARPLTVSFLTGAGERPQGCTVKKKDRQTDRQTDRQKNRQTDRQKICKFPHVLIKKPFFIYGFALYRKFSSSLILFILLSCEYSKDCVYFIFKKSYNFVIFCVVCGVLNLDNHCREIPWSTK
jgi:hypothetical protein